MTVSIINADCRKALRDLPAASVHTCVTSPPYFGLRDYGHADQIGLEESPDAFIAQMVSVFREVRRVLRDDGTLWLNLGDSYAGSGKGGGPGRSTLQGGQQTQQAAAAAGRALIASSRRDDAPVPRSALAYPGLKAKDLMGIPWAVAFALRADGWFLRQDIIWAKPNPMPEPVADRCTKAHEYIFLLSKSESYEYDADAICEAATKTGTPAHLMPGKGSYERQAQTPRTSGNKERKPPAARGAPDGTGNNQAGSVPWTGTTRNKRSVWTVPVRPFEGAHFATFPPDLIEPCILAGSPIGGTVLDPFGGAGTTGLVADRLQRHAVLIELNPEYADMARRRIHSDAPLLAVG